MSAEQAQTLEDVVTLMVRENDDRAAQMMSLALAFKFANASEPDVLEGLGGRDDA
jgi:hypothetical protein